MANRSRTGLVAGVALTALSVLPSVLSTQPAVQPATRPAPQRTTTAAATTTAATTATTAAAGQLRIFFGNIHAHTKYSDGTGTPAEAFAQARDQGRLDFLAVSEHNHNKAEQGIEPNTPPEEPRKDGIMIATQPNLYNSSDPASLASAARTFTSDDHFVAIFGQEFSTISSGNHINVFEVANVIDVPNGAFATLYDQWLPQHQDSLNEPPLIQLNHPDFRADMSESTSQSQRFNDYGLDDYNRNFNDLIAHSEKYVSLIEIVSGPALTNETDVEVTSRLRHERDYWFYLNQGFHVAPTAIQDNHFRTWGTITRARTAVLAARLTKPDVLRALKARRVYATEDQNLQIRFRVNGQEMGSIIRSNNAQDLSIQVDISDPDEPDAEYRVELYRDDIGGDMIEDAADVATLEGNNSVTFNNQRYESGRVFFFIKVSQVGSDGEENFAWTAPIWIEPGESVPPVNPAQPTASPSPVAARFVFSRNSEVYHFAECLDAARIRPENRVESDVEPEDRRLHTGCPRLR